MVFVPVTSLSAMSLRNSGNVGAFGMNAIAGLNAVPETFTVSRLIGNAPGRSDGSTSLLTCTEYEQGGLLTLHCPGACTRRSARFPAARRKGRSALLL